MLKRIIDPADHAGIQPQRQVIASRQKVEAVDLEIKIAVASRDERNVQAVKPGAAVGHQGAHVGIHSDSEARTLDGFIRAVMQADDQTLAAARNGLQIPLGRQELDSGVKDLAAAPPAVHAGDLVRRAVGRSKRGHISLDDFVRRPVKPDFAICNPDAARAQILYGRHVVRHEQHGPSPATQILHRADAFLLERGVANRQHLIDDEHVGLEVRGHREAKPQAHAARITLDGRVDETLHARELDDRIEFDIDLLLLHPEDGAVQVDVLAPGQFLVKPGADLQKRRDATPRAYPARGGVGDFREYFEERALAGTVAADDADDLPLVHLE